ncbi:MAG: 2-oxoisovalerate dehydrogenase subunit beta [Fimbriimonadales bacterium]|nr:MAG: 2-oxoisovalerate dehydrogenase subunit beta [Fimbriimonadales bacterium]
MSPEIAAPPIEKKNYLTALKDAIRLEMQRNPDMICIGEDIGLLGGAFGVTEGLQEEFGADRVIDAPISEAAIVGSAIGMALRGRTVMVEMQFIDFISCGFDQIVNNAATMAYRTAGKASVPIVIRGPSGGYGGGGPYHSQQNEAWFAHSPGLKVVCPSTPRDAYGLMVASLRDPNPVIFYEVKDLYRKREIEEEIPEDTFVPLGSASVVREGSDITIISYGNPMHMCIKVAGMLADDGVEAELIDLRTLVPLDEETIYRSVKKTGRVLVVNEASRTCGFAGEVIARINENCFEYLDAPPLRVTRADTPVPWVQPLELAVLPSVEQIYETALRIAKF